MLVYFEMTLLWYKHFRPLIKVNESRYKQRGVTLHFSTGKNLLKKHTTNNTIYHDITFNVTLINDQLFTKFKRKGNHFNSFFEK